MTGVIANWGERMPWVPSLRVWRERRFYSVGELGDRVGLSAAAIRAIERGERRPRSATVERLAQVLGVNPDDLLRALPADAGAPVFGYAGIVYTQHAREQMTERGISEAVVVEVLASPDRTYAAHRAVVAERILHGKPWRVVFDEEPGFDAPAPVVRIVTVYRIDKLKAR